MAEPILPDPNSPSNQIKWPDWVPEKLRLPENAPLAEFQDQEKALAGYVHLSRKLGQAFFKPADNASPEERRKFHDKLGVPKDPKEYDVELDEGGKRILPDYLLDEAKNAAIDLGVPKDAFKGLLNAILTTGKAKLNTMTQQVEGLAQNYRTRFDQESGAEKDVRRNIVKTQMENDPDIDDTLKGIFQAFPILRDHPFVTSALELKYKAKNGSFPASKSDGAGQPTVGQLETIFNQALQDKAYLDPLHPGHAAALQRVENLAKQLTP